MANNNSFASGLGKGVLGVGVGFALYFLIRNLRLGGGFGFGGEPGAREAGSEAPSVPSPRPEPPLPKDTEPLLFVVFHPEGVSDFGKGSDLATRARREAAFHRIDLGTEMVTPREIYRRAGAAIRDKAAKPLSIDEVIARAKAGGRDDVRLINLGGIRAGTWDDVLDTLMGSGINHWTLWEQAPADRQPSGSRPGEPYKGPKWDLYRKTPRSDNPDEAGHYIFEYAGTAHWGLDRRLHDKEPSRVSGNVRGYYGRAYR